MSYIQSIVCRRIREAEVIEISALMMSTDKPCLLCRFLLSSKGAGALSQKIDNLLKEQTGLQHRYLMELCWRAISI